MEQKDSEIETVKKYLQSYAINKKMLIMEKYSKEYFAEGGEDDPLLSDSSNEAFIKAKMYEVRRFIMSIEDGNARLMLFHHYIKGISVERCAEMMNISRTSGFRLRKRALKIAGELYDKNLSEKNSKTRSSFAA